MEVPLAPCCISWSIGIGFFCFQVGPELVYVFHMENYPSPVAGHLSLLKVQNWIFRAERLKGRKIGFFTSIENLEAQQLVVKMYGFFHIAYLDRDGGYSVYIHISLLAPYPASGKSLVLSQVAYQPP